MFFKEIYEMMPDGMDLVITVRKNGEGLSTSVLPKNNNVKDEAKNLIVPLVVSGTPDELDSGFIAAISEPVRKTTGLFVSMTEYEQSATAASQNSKAETDRKAKFDKLVKQADDFEKNKKYREAITALKSSLGHASDKEKSSVETRISKLEQKISQGSLFGGFDVPEETAASPHEISPEPLEEPDDEEYPENPDEEDYNNDEDNY